MAGANAPALTAWLTAALDEIETKARAAMENRATDSEQWHWVGDGPGSSGRPGDGITDEPLNLNAQDEFVDGENRSVSLRSVEQYATSAFGRPSTLPSFVLRGVEELRPGPAAHIALHDPRSVLARVEAERAICRTYVATIEVRDEEEGRLRGGGAKVVNDWTRADLEVDTMERLVRVLAYGHRFDFPGFDPSWAPEGVSVG